MLLLSYVSGRVAACASKVSDYQRNFQFYEDNAKKTLLGTLDEHAVRLLLWLQWEYSALADRTADQLDALQVGSAGHPRRKKLILTKESGIVMNAENVIVKVQLSIRGHIEIYL